jgi:hypothetical protein
MPPVPAVNRKEFGFGKTPAGGDAVILFGKEIPVQMAVGVVGGLGALLLFLRAKASGSNVISAGAAAATQPSAATTWSSTGYDPDAQAIADLQSELTQLSSTTTTTAAATTSTSSPSLTDLSSEVLTGVGYNPPSTSPASPITTPAGSYEYLSGQSAVDAANASGAALFYQPEPGVFEPTSLAAIQNPGGVLAGTGTAIYVGVPTPEQPLPTSPTASTTSSAVVAPASGLLSAAAA